MASKNTSIAILFADISDSTHLYEALGDSTAQALISDTLGTIAEVVERYSGTVIKTIGDEIMCTFSSAEDAATAACEMHEILEDEGPGNGGESVSIRIGTHYGSAIMENDDVFGDAVNIAARMTDQAKARQIITTRSTIDLLPPVLQASARFVDHIPVKGKKADVEIFEIIWQQEDITRMATDRQTDKKQPPSIRLKLSYHGRDVVLDHSHSSIILGRSQSCGLSVSEKLASRQHVRIELRREKFFIIDQSTNGTHVRSDDNGDTFLRREEMSLSGTGYISLGRSFLEHPSELVQFSHE